MAQTATTGMQIDVLKYKNSDNILKDCKALGDIECFLNYASDPEEGLPKREVMVYVVLLYSKDSFLNKKPIDPLNQRMVRAATISGLQSDSEAVKEMMFNLGSEKIRDLILGYLIHQNKMIWMERCIIEAQILENQRIRFKPISNKVVAPVTQRKKKEEEVDEKRNVELDDSKYIVEASSKKSSLTDDFTKYYDLLKKYDLEIFADHDNVKDQVKKSKVTLESVAE